MITLSYCGVKQLSKLSMKLLKVRCKEHFIPTLNTSKKEDLCKALGRVLYQEKIVIRKDDNLEISLENLKLAQKQ